MLHSLLKQLVANRIVEKFVEFVYIRTGTVCPPIGYLTEFSVTLLLFGLIVSFPVSITVVLPM
jgi:hypothetical protein